MFQWSVCAINMIGISFKRESRRKVEKQVLKIRPTESIEYFHYFSILLLSITGCLYTDNNRKVRREREKTGRD